MLYNIAMARGPSGRIVLEIKPRVKRQLYGALAQDGLTLKNWFLRQSVLYLASRKRLPALFWAREPRESKLSRAKRCASNRRPTYRSGPKVRLHQKRR
jgi:hypothetical protein